MVDSIIHIVAMPLVGACIGAAIAAMYAEQRRMDERGELGGGPGHWKDANPTADELFRGGRDD